MGEFMGSGVRLRVAFFEAEGDGGSGDEEDGAEDELCDEGVTEEEPGGGVARESSPECLAKGAEGF